MNNHKILFLLWAALLLGVLPMELYAADRSGSKPQWVSKGEASLNSRRTNSTYYFKVIQNMGPDLQILKQNNTNALADHIGKLNHVQGLEALEVSNQTGNGQVLTRENYTLEFRNEFTSEAFYASLVDEYWETETTAANGVPQYHYYALYAVSASGKARPMFDNFEVTRSYGAGPAFMSVIPGVGQLYKGQTLKGSLMLSGAVVGVGAIILCENRRSYYQTRIIEQPKFAREYSKKSDDWQTGRNIAIGVSAALVAWSVIDAAVTPGVTRIKVHSSTSLAFRPAVLATPDATALGASLAFTF